MPRPTAVRTPAPRRRRPDRLMASNHVRCNDKGSRRFGPAVVIASCALLVVAACTGDGGSPSGGDVGPTTTSVVSDGQLAVALDTDAAEAPLGEPVEVTVTVTNDGDRSVSAP